MSDEFTERQGASDLIQSFADLFDGRRDAVGTEAGGALRVDPDERLVRAGAHLYGDVPMGAYPMTPDLKGGWVCKFGCVDIDVLGPTHKRGLEAEVAWTAARNLIAVLNSEGITGWQEVTKSGGMHVWVFAQDWVPAATMRRALLVACEIAGCPTDEVNPKSESFPNPDSLGNYIRLPYPGHLASRPGLAGARRVVLDEDGEPLSLATFVADAEESLARESDLRELAELWRPPAPPVEIGDVEVDPEAVKLLNGLAFTILTNPPLEGQDRSTRLYKLAAECARSGITPEQAVYLQHVADELHGQKFVGRADAERRHRETVARAYA